MTEEKTPGTPQQETPPLTEMDEQILAMNQPKPPSCKSDTHVTVQHANGTVSVELAVEATGYERYLMEQRRKPQPWYRVLDW